MELLSVLQTGEPNSEDIKTNFYLGRLMSPDETTAALQRHPEPQRCAPGEKWALCGDISESAFARWKASPADPLVMLVSCISSTAGANYLVLTHQLAQSQHRFVLPLWEPRVATFLQAATQNGIEFELSNDGAKDAAVWLYRPRRADLLLATKLAVGAAALTDIQRWILEYPLAIASVGQYDAIPSLNVNERVKDISVSLILPELEHLVADSAQQQRTH